MRRRGFEIRARNVRNAGGELDIVASLQGTICFVEVKYRRDGSFGAPACFVTPAKQRRLCRAAAMFLCAHDGEAPPPSVRFDVLGIERRPGGRWRFDHIPDAFEAIESFSV